MMEYFFGFITVFDLIPNLYADLSGFADRQFYTDFWNATNFDEYARKWNRLVHEYLHRHYYLEFLKRYNFSIFKGLVCTFLFSVVFHEIFFTVAFGRVSLYLSCLQLLQLLLLFVLQRMKGTMAGNLFFWGGNIFGVTSVGYIYTYEYGNFHFYPGGNFTFDF